jgi:hypothetical protein
MTSRASAAVGATSAIRLQPALTLHLDPFRTAAGLPCAAAGEIEPHPPVTRRRPLFVARPVVKATLKLLQLLRTHLRDRRLSLLERQRGEPVRGEPFLGFGQLPGRCGGAWVVGGTRVRCEDITGQFEVGCSAEQSSPPTPPIYAGQCFSNSRVRRQYSSARPSGQPFCCQSK